MQQHGSFLGVVIAIVALIAIVGCTAGVGEEKNKLTAGIETTQQQRPSHAKLFLHGNDKLDDAPEDAILKQLSGKDRDSQRKWLEEVAISYIGQFSRGNENEYFEFYAAPKSDIRLLRGRYIGIGEYSYSYALTSMYVFDDGTIRFKVKGRTYCAERIGDSLAVLYPNKTIHYCPMIPADQLVCSIKN